MTLPASTTVAIIGAGFSGVCAAIRLARAGQHNFVVLERGAGPGGVWRQNTYPGAACDVPSSLYSFSFVDDFDWPGTHGAWSEIVSYINHCIDKFGVRDKILYNVDVESSVWDGERNKWTLTTSDGAVRSDFVISACGLFNKPSVPDIAGLDTFTGPSFHSAEWDNSFDPSGKAVAVVGTGCSAAQIVPELARTAAKLVVFQRSPCHVMPKHERRFSDDERLLYKRFPILRALERAGFEKGSAAFVAFQFDDAANQRMNGDILADMTGKIMDPGKRQQLLPTFPIGGKRPISSDNILQTIDSPGVDLVAAPIEHVTAEGIVTADGEVHAVDAIVFATGFRVSDYLAPLNVVGADGRVLADAWKDGAYALLGMMVDGFPNMFMVYGPNSNAVGSIIEMIEPQVDYIVRQIELSQREGRLVEADAAMVRQFNETLQERLSRSIYGKRVAENYFSTAGGKIVTQFPGSPAQFAQEIAALDPRAFLADVAPASGVSGATKR